MRLIRARSFVLAAAVSGFACSSEEPASTPHLNSVYVVSDVPGAFARNEITSTGALLLEELHGFVLVEATERERLAIASLSYSIAPVDESHEHPWVPLRLLAFPEGDSAYHDFQELTAVLQETAAEHANMFRLTEQGVSVEGRPIWLGKVSDNVAVDEDEPEVLFTFHQHAREHLTVEQGLYLLQALTDDYDQDDLVKRLVDNREIWLFFDLNPDGGEFDIASGDYQSWRKNRQPNEGTTHIGIDLNRNWSYQWGCCNGGSNDPESGGYRGPSPFSAPEVATVRDFVNSRLIGGVQQIRMAVDVHTPRELILWPYSHTLDEYPLDMNRDDYDAMAAIGRDMAAMNGFTPKQWSRMYIADGTINDWLYGEHRILNYTFELYPKSANFYPAGELVSAQTERNRRPLLHAVDMARCPYVATGKHVEHCGASLVYKEDFEAVPAGWRNNPDQNDSSPSVVWQTASAGRSLCGGAAAAPSSGARLLVASVPLSEVENRELEGGTATADSIEIAIPAGGNKTILRFAAYLRHDEAASDEDMLAVSVATPTEVRVVHEDRGRVAAREPEWQPVHLDLSAFMGQTIRLRFACIDGGMPNVIECGVDDISITTLPP
jgi:hypothetical protein